MAVELSNDVRDEAIASIQAYAEEALELRLGNLQAGALLDFFLEEIGPSVYNRAVADVQHRLQARLMEIDAEMQQEEFGYSTSRSRSARRR